MGRELLQSPSEIAPLLTHYPVHPRLLANLTNTQKNQLALEDQTFLAYYARQRSVFQRLEKGITWSEGKLKGYRLKIRFEPEGERWILEAYSPRSISSGGLRRQVGQVIFKYRRESIEDLRPATLIIYGGEVISDHSRRGLYDAMIAEVINDLPKRLGVWHLLESSKSFTLLYDRGLETAQKIKAPNGTVYRTAEEFLTHRHTMERSRSSGLRILGNKFCSTLHRSTWPTLSKITGSHANVVP